MSDVVIKYLFRGQKLVHYDNSRLVTVVGWSKKTEMVAIRFSPKGRVRYSCIWELGRPRSDSGGWWR